MAIFFAVKGDEKQMMENKIKWRAVVENDKAFDGCFFYAVKSTGVFCRPSCQSRSPLQNNVEFFDTSEEAMKTGYRPCKRCRPDLIDYKPALEIAEKMKETIDAYYNEKNRLAEELSKMNIAQHRMVEIFRERFNVTPSKYADGLRIQAAKEKLAGSSDSIISIALYSGFDSVSAFYGFFRKHTQMAPGEYRQLHFLSRAPVEQNFYTYETVLGSIIVVSDGNAVNAVQFENMTSRNGKKISNALTDRAAKQLEEYFFGKRRQFDLPLRPYGTAFQQSVWKGLLSIPYGDTRSYKQVAQMIGNPGASRAIGMANNKNPILIVIPCHRVIGSNGALVGYAGGLEMKKKILELEKNFMQELKS